MNARTAHQRTATRAALVAAFGLLSIGCSKTESRPDSAEGAYLASGGVATPAAGEQAAVKPNASHNDQPSAAPSTPPTEPATTLKSEKPEPSTAVAGDGVKPAPKVPLRQLRADLSPAQMLEFLSEADKDMQVIVTGRSGITDPQEARDTLVHIVKMKLEASRRLSKHADSDAGARSEASRGELQSLSHLAALGDLKAAEELEKLATANLQSDDPRLVSDSRLVLIGFALESLENGDQSAVDRIISYVNQIAASEAKPDVPALMVMGQARQSLASYGHDEKARQVRDVIIDLFANSPEPEIAQMAAQMAGNVRFDAIDKLRGQVVDGEIVAAGQWREAVERLIDESADLQTVQYLAGTALEFESLQRRDLVEATYEVMAARFNDPASATGREVQLAMAANQARGNVVGQLLDLDLPQTDGSPLALTDLRGKVVLMPFWATGFPESLQLIPRLKRIRDAYPDDVVVVGVNLDVEGSQVEKFVQESGLGFPSFRAATSATAEVANPLAAKFGMVSMPFTAVLDQEGRVAAINFTGRNLEETVKALVDR